MPRKKRADINTDQNLFNQVITEHDLLTVPLAEETSEEINIHHPGWTDYVLSQLTEKEKHNEFPKANGLRRLIEPLLNCVIQEDHTDIIDIPTASNEGRYVARTVLTLLMKYDSELIPVTFSDIGDAYAGNCTGEYIKYISGVASSRSQGRCYRKALRLQCIAAEEIGNYDDIPSVDLEKPKTNIDTTQIKAIENLCRRVKVNVEKFINMGKEKYESIEKVPYDIAQKMIAHLNEIQNNNATIPDSIKL